MNKDTSHILIPINDIHSFRKRLVDWFGNNMRKYPWRETDDPFKILIAEMMLRRTRADQVKSVYTDLFTRYPDVQSMAEAEENDLQRVLYPLGLRWRNAAFQLVAREIKEKHEYRVPNKKDQLVSLPGVGEYVAGAVLSIAYGRAEWIVDNNVTRVFKRYFSVRTSKEGRRDKQIIEIAKVYVSVGDPRKANLAILDFAALICTPRNPKCEECRLKMQCSFFSHDTEQK